MKYVARAMQWIVDRGGLQSMLRPILEHPVPKTGWAYIFGSATLFAFIIQVITGIALSSAYVTSTADAYESLRFITYEAPLGRLMRGMHYWGASAMVLLIGLHVIRVFLMGSYKYPREVTWLTGSVLLLFTLALAFTGQLLRWDQTAIWSTFVAAAQASRLPVVGESVARFILAGNTIGGATLSRFFAFHVFFIPAIVFAFLAYHLFLVLYHGISEPPKPGEPVDPKTYRERYHKLLERDGEDFWPYAAARDTIAGLALLGIIIALALFVGPPDVEEPPDPSVIEAFPRPDWYFLWFFALLALLPPEIEDAIIIIAPLVFGFLLFLLPIFFNKGERSARRRPWAVGVVLIAVTLIATFWVAGERANWSPEFQTKALPAEVVGQTSGPIERGARLYFTQGCQYCHAIAGEGGQRGPALTYAGSRYNRQYLITRILGGGINMPAYANNLTSDELNDLIAFLESRRAPESPGRAQEE